MNRTDINYVDILNFYQNKRVLITGNTGFKGAWLTQILLKAGAEVTGYSLNPPTSPSLFAIAGLDKQPGLRQITGDVRNLEELRKTFEQVQPSIVLHLAAQPIVRESYRDPVNTYSTNVMGTVNVLECVRNFSSVKSFLNVTTDKVYKNYEWEYGYRESDVLDGFDPYSNSKSCSELITHSYRDSFFRIAEKEGAQYTVGISTARAGNVIGGGDFACDRIIPDCIRTLSMARKNGENEALISIRNPYSTRPYEHVLEPLFVYLMIAKYQYTDKGYAGYYNVGPDDCDCVNTGDLAELFCHMWNEENAEIKTGWETKAETIAPHEADFLKLDCSRLKSRFSWSPRWHIEEAVRQTVRFTKIWLNGADAEQIRNEMNRQIEIFIK